MPDIEFTADELADFVTVFDRIPSWKLWKRRKGEHGEDILEIVVDGAARTTLRVAKTGNGGFAATGFGGWGLTVCHDFGELLGILAGTTPEVRAAGRQGWTVDDAA